MTYDVSVERTAECPTAVVKADTTWEEFPARWPTMLDEVWAFLSARPGLRRDGHNVFVYRRDVPGVELAVEVGVQVTGPFEPTGRVVPSLVSWEIYGDPDPQTGRFDVTVCWQLA
jgi:hypothetical protein